jgi:hypothetical protein
VALAIAVVKGLVGPEIIEKAYGPLRLDLPMAPGLGLVLQEVGNFESFQHASNFLWNSSDASLAQYI